MTTLSQFLYLSQVRGDKPFETIAVVVAEARQLNAEQSCASAASVGRMRSR